jgi:hypothetical protein
MTYEFAAIGRQIGGAKAGAGRRSRFSAAR